MANIKYTDDNGDHTGTLTLKEYYQLAHGYNEDQAELASRYSDWNSTDYEPFKRAISKKYQTNVIKALITA